MAGGRPSKYTPELIEKTKEYLANWQSTGDVIPSIAGLAGVLEVRRETIHEWCREDEKEDFSNIVAQILRKQEQTLANKGLTGDFNSSITKLLLTKHGYSDKIEQEHTGRDGGPISWNVLPVRPVEPKKGDSDV